MDFDRVAASFDNPRRIERARHIAERIGREIAGCENEPVLEYGCGTGLISFCLAERFSDIIMMDSSPGMIEEARRKVTSAQASGLRPVLLDMSAAAYDGPPFAAIYSSMVLHHIPDTDKIVRAFHGALRHRGVLCIVDLDEDDGAFHAEETDFTGHHGFRHADIMGAMEKAGFESCSIESFYRGSRMVNGVELAYSLFCATGVKECDSKLCFCDAGFMALS